ncbi:MAG: right-handed parallel beta-helix repeat-containing protein, partial [Deltaproteobacteria bacterium]|nr:right-handed parallel beta-helix repeat-containing protein [Deltaproteobacteria bacterium]
MTRLFVPLAILWLAACGDAESALMAGPDGGGGSPPKPDAGASCAPGELELADGSCRAAGVDPDDCAEGFVPSDGGCDPVLPDPPCAPGMIAVPGDTECREIMPCGTAPWGDIPVESDTQYVDGTYAGGDSDGTADKPWTTISSAVTAATPGAIVAVAAGSYPEDVTLNSAALRLRGRCPSLVEIVGQEPQYAAVVIWAAGTEVGGLATRGPGGGIAVAALDVSLDHVWVHDTEDYYGLGAQADVGPASLIVTDSLVEGAYDTGMSALGGDLTVERCLIRDPGGGEGLGVRAAPHPQTDTLGSITIRDSLLERNRYFGIYAAASHLQLEATVVRDTEADPQGGYGVGAQIRDDQLTQVLGSGTIVSSVFSGNRTTGLVIADSAVTMDSSVMRDTRPDAQTQGLGRGIQVITDRTDGPRASFLLSRSLLERNREAALVIVGSEMTANSALIRETLPTLSGGIHGRGMSIQVHPDNGRRSNVQIAGSVVEQCHTSGIAVFASDAIIEDTVVRDTAPQPTNDFYGRGITLQGSPETWEPTSATLSRVLVERTDDVGISVVGSDAIVEWTIVRDTSARAADDQFGDGIVVDGSDGHPA